MLTMSIETAHNLWPYTERTGDRAADDATLLLADPDFLLSDTERDEAANFAHGLAAGYYDWLTCSAVSSTENRPVTLEELDRQTAGASEFTYYPAYFATEEGQNDIESLGISGAADIREELLGKLAAGNDIDKKVRRLASVHSEQWYKTQLAEQLTEDPGNDQAFEEPDSFTVNFDPDKLIDKFQALRDYKGFFSDVADLLGDEPATNSRAAKEVLLSVHRAKVNYQMALLYPRICNLVDQLADSPDTDRTNRWTIGVQLAVPLGRALYNQEEKDDRQKRQFVDGFTRRLDLLRYGAVFVRPHANYSPISPKLYEMESDQHDTAKESPEFDADAKKIMSETSWKADELKKFLEAVLTEWEFLSERQADWEEATDREGRSENDKWQIIISPKAASLETDGRKKVMWVPENFNRTLTQTGPSGALPVSAHELTHVLQAEWNDRLAQIVPLARIKGRRSITGFEMGGIHEERQVFGALGISRPRNNFYLMGLQRKIDGGNVAEVTRAVHEAKGDQGGSTPEKRLSTVGQALRLFRNGKNNSQPLDYLEQELMLEALRGQPTDRIRAIAIGAVSFALMDSAALHRVDILHIPNSQDIKVPSETVLRVYKEKFHKTPAARA
jgi:hypothetical protein